MPNPTLYHNGRVMVARGRFEPASLLLDGERIAEVIPLGDESPFLGRADVATVDLGSRHVIPGFVDAHFHVLGFALKRLRCDLGRVSSAEALVEELKRYVRVAPEGAVMGVGWDESRWRDGALPTRDQLDAVSLERPVYARRVCCHVGVVNTVLLERLGATLDPALKRFVDVESGLITEDVVYAANRASRPSRDAVAGTFAGAFADLNALGVTAVHDIVAVDSVDAYVAGLHAARAAGARLRIDALLVGTVGQLEELSGRTSDLDSDWFRAVGVKRFADGSLGARTAALNEPYADADTRGELLLDRDALRETFRQCADLGITCAVHAIGDRAVGQILTALDGIDKGERLFRIEHAEILDEDSIQALASSRIFVSMQPNFARNWGGTAGLYERRLGLRRRAMANPFSILEARGVDFVFGSDGMPPGPLYGIRGATNHPISGQSIDAASALWRYTGMACTLGQHRRRAGRLAQGNLADFTVLSADPLVADPDAVDVDATIVGGREVFRRPLPA
jgi:predicted amidohydrolase YtcJ